MKNNSYQVFANKIYLETKSQGETVDALMNNFLELGEEEAEAVAIQAVEDYRGELQYRGEQQYETEKSYICL